MDVLLDLFADGRFLPRGDAWLRTPGLTWLYAAADGVTALAFLSISCALLTFVRRRRGLAFGWMFVLFAAFIFASGLTHLASVGTLWQPLYWLDAALRVPAALAALVTAALLWRLIPRALALPSPADHARVNAALRGEIEERQRAHEQLSRAVAQREAADQQAQASEERLQVALDAAAMGVWEIDLLHGSAIRSPRHDRIFGYPDGAPRWSWEMLLAHIHPAERQLVAELIERPAAEPTFALECRIRRPDGQERWVSLRGQVQHEENQPRRVIGVVTDISRRRALEQELRDARAAAEAASRAKSDFLASMSHEIRTPMNGVLGMVELLQTTRLDDTQRYYARTIQSSGRTLLTVINDILDFSRVEAGRLELAEQPIDLTELVEDAVAPFRSSSVGNVRLVASIAPETPLHLLGDPVRVQQIIGNLLNNAFKFTEAGEVTLRLRGAPEGDRVRLHCEITDTGIGIAPAEQAQLFRPFTQVGTGSRRGGQRGSGLGLTICQRLVQLMEGSIDVASAPGVGSTFRFDILLKPDPAPAGLDLQGLDDRHLLVIDDSDAYLHIIREQAVALGMRVTALTRPDHAVAVAAHDQPDIIMIDLDMPVMDGFALEREFSAPALAEVPRVLVTASSAPPSRRDLAGTGFSAAYVKPTSATQLRAMLLLALRDRELEDATAGVPARPSYRGRRVLVAEDNPINRQVIEAMLRQFDLEVELVGDGITAVRRATAGESGFDLILMDCEMPNMDGYLAARTIRQFERAHGRRAVPIVALTAHALAEFRQRSLDAGMDEHVNKPLSLEALEAVLERYLRRH